MLRYIAKTRSICQQYLDNILNFREVDEIRDTVSEEELVSKDGSDVLFKAKLGQKGSRDK